MRLTLLFIIALEALPHLCAAEHSRRQPAQRLDILVTNREFSHCRPAHIYCRVFNLDSTESVVLPDSTTFRAEILSGSEYVSLHLAATGSKGKVLTKIPHVNGMLYTIDLQIEKGPKDSTPVLLRMSSLDSTILPAEFQLTLWSSRILVISDPPTVALGDTGCLVFRKILDDGSIGDFPPDQLFNVEISSDTGWGTLLSPNGNVFGSLLKCVKNAVRVIAGRRGPARLTICVYATDCECVKP